MDFSEKVIWITGASSGIGEHLAYALADRGARLVLSARDEQELARVRNNCRGSSEILVRPFDVTDFEGIPAVVEEVTAHFGRVHLLINNAGVSQRARVRETDFEVDRQIMAVNYLGPVALTKALLPHFLEQRGGHFVVISSILGKVSVPGRSAYAASKHALHGFFDSLRAEVYDDNIRVTVICPGYVHTNLPINALKGDGSRYQQPETDRQGLEPSEFARKALQAIEAEKKETYIGGAREVGAVYVKRWLPALFFLLIRKVMKA